VANDAALRVTSVKKSYALGETRLEVLRGVDLAIPGGQMVSVMGPSGVGKSTLLNCISGLDTPDEGRIEVLGEDIAARDDEGRTLLRRQRIGIVYQFFNLVPTLSARENVMLPFLIDRVPVDERAVDASLDRVGMTKRAGHLPAQLSGGEMQLVSIARAIVRRPPLLLADEPTGNVNVATGKKIMALLADVVKEVGAAMLLVTHNPARSPRRASSRARTCRAPTCTIGSRASGSDVGLFALIFDRMVRVLAARNLWSDRFGTLAAILGVALGTATVNVVLVLDVNTVRVESGAFASDPRVAKPPDTIAIRGVRGDGAEIPQKSARQATHEDYEVMRSAIRLGSLAAFLVGALIVFFTFGVVVDRRRREVALLRSLGALPKQVGAIFVREALIIGLSGAALGLLSSIPMAYLAAAAGITTTGRARIALHALTFPWSSMALVSAIGAATALLGVLRPVRDVLRLDVSRTLRPRFLDDEGPRAAARKARAVTLIALPFTILVYALMRPFFRQALPSLTFFVVEAGLTCVAFLATLLLVPELVRRLGGLTVRLVPGRAGAVRLVTQRRVEHQGHELSWSVSGVMMVFALLLALHIATFGLKREIMAWADDALHGELFLYPVDAPARADAVTPYLPPGERACRFSWRTPWPNAVQAVDRDDLVWLAETVKRPDLVAIARKLGPGKAILSKMMAKRYRVREGDFIELSGRGGTKRLAIVGVTDGLGFIPYQQPYRNSKTYATIDAADQELLTPYTESLGAVAVIPDGERPLIERWIGQMYRQSRLRGMMPFPGSYYRWIRVRETQRDFVIFDLILFLTSVLAAIGIANQLVLSVHARQREIALFRVLGMTGGDVRRMIVLEGAFIGMLGGGLAALMGVPLGAAAVGALKTVSAFEVSFAVPLRFVVATIVGAVIVSLGASLYPAAKAAKRSSAESVHYE
jgi:putative ABC transport system permease protein